MSKHEKPMILRDWEQVGGTLPLENHIVPRSPGVGRRLLDAVIIVDGERRIASQEKRSASMGMTLIIVQAKTSRLGLSRLGQAFFSRELVRTRSKPKSVRTVALCTADDAVLRPIAEGFEIEVVSGRPRRDFRKASSR